jgi:hypothetical protein
MSGNELISLLASRQQPVDEKARFLESAFRSRHLPDIRAKNVEFRVMTRSAARL